jgi:hypothetical protein
VDGAQISNNCVNNATEATSPLVFLQNVIPAVGSILSAGIEFCNKTSPNLPRSPIDPPQIADQIYVKLRSGYDGTYISVSSSSVMASGSTPADGSIFQLQAISHK